LVEGGETIEITDRGRPVAILGPLPKSGALDQLRASGDITPATATLEDLAAPMTLPTGEPSASEVLSRLRRDER